MRLLDAGSASGQHGNPLLDFFVCYLVDWVAAPPGDHMIIEASSNLGNRSWAEFSFSWWIARVFVLLKFPQTRMEKPPWTSITRGEYLR